MHHVGYLLGLERTGEEEDSFVAGAEESELVVDKTEDDADRDDGGEGDGENFVGYGEFHTKREGIVRIRVGHGLAPDEGVYRPFSRQGEEISQGAGINLGRLRP
jgi:hypothetical protein